MSYKVPELLHCCNATSDKIWGCVFIDGVADEAFIFWGGEPKRSWQKKKKTRPQFVLVFEIEETANIKRSKGYNPTALADLERLDPGFRDRFELELTMARLRL